MSRHPGEEFLHEGLADLAAGKRTVPALLVSIGAPRLVECGVVVPGPPIASPEHALYALLATTHGNGAHAAYNAWIRRLVSLERSLAHERRRGRAHER